MAKTDKKVKKDKKDKKAQAENAAKPEGEQKKGGVLFTVVSLFAALFVIAAVLSVFLFMIVKMNVFGVSDIYRDAIAKVPVLKLALPAAEQKPSDMSFEELLVKYESSEAEKLKLQGEIKEADDKIEELSKAKSEFDAKTMVNDEKTAQLTQQLAAYEAQKKMLEDMKYDLDRAAASGDKEAFAKYYEGVSPEVAQEIYAQIVKGQNMDDEKKKFIKLFESMDTKTSASIIETLGAGRIDFITETLGALKKDNTVDIISKLPPDLAAQVTLRLSGN